MKLPNTTVKQYIEGLNRKEVDYALKYGIFKPVDLYQVGSILERPFIFVKDMQEMFNDGCTLKSFIEFIVDNKLAEGNQVSNESIYKLQSFLMWFKEQADFINDLESSALGHIPNGDEQMAGIEKFNIFHPYPQLRNLAGGGDYDKIERVKQWPYSHCFLEMKYVSTLNEYEKALFNIRSKKK